MLVKAVAQALSHIKRNREMLVSISLGFFVLVDEDVMSVC